MRGVSVGIVAFLVAVSAAAQSSSDIFVFKSAPSNAPPGTNVTFTITLGNNGPNSAPNAAFNDTLPANTTFVSSSQISGPTFTCTTPNVGDSGGNVACSIATFAVNGLAQFSIVVNVPANAQPGGTIQNSVTASSGSSDPTPGNNSATTFTTVGFGNADLSVSKEAPSASPPGSDLTFTITIVNNGPDDAANVSFTDPLPSSTTFVSLSPLSGPAFNCTTPNVGDPGGTVTCTTPTLFMDGVAQFNIVVHIPPSATGTITNTVTVSTDSTDPIPGNNSATSNTAVMVSNLADVAVSKTGPQFAAPGSNVTFVITVTNFGPNDATNVTLNDTLGAGLTFVPPLTQTSGPTFNCPGNTTPCSISKLTNGSSATFNLVATVSSTPGTYQNTASVTSDNDPNPDNNSAVASVTAASADVGVAKSGPATAVAGGPTFNYSITLSNSSGPNEADNASFTDALPAGLTLVAVTQNTGPSAFCNSTNPVTCNVPVLLKGESANFTITVQPSSTIANGTVLTNTATATSSTVDPNSNNNSSSVMTTVSANADVAIVKSGPATVVAGSTITYTITVTNNGPATASSVSWADTLPANTTFVSESQTTGPTFNCTTFPSAVSCGIASLAPSASATFSITAQLANVVATAPLSNTVSETSATPDSNTGNNISTVITAVNSNSDVAITKTGPNAAFAGNNITYTVSVTNNGPAPANNAMWTDTLPAGTTFVSESQTSGPTFTCTTGATISCSIASLAASATATFSVTAKVGAGTANGTILSNTATVSSQSPDPTPGNNSSNVNTTVSVSADVSVTKTGPAAATAGSNITYTITVANAGPSNAASVTLNDTLPPGTTFVSESQTSGPTFTCTTGATISCSIATLNAGTSAVFSVTVSIGGSVPNGTTLTNTAVVASTTPDPNSANNTSSLPTLVSANADLSVTKSGPATTPSNTTATYTVTAANAGPANASTVSLTETVPAGMTFVSVNQTSGPAFACSGSGPIVCTIATFNSGASATFQFTFNVPLNITPGTQSSDTVTITSSTPDPNPANNTASATTTVGASIPALSPLALALMAMMLAMVGWMIAKR